MCLKITRQSSASSSVQQEVLRIELKRPLRDKSGKPDDNVDRDASHQVTGWSTSAFCGRNDYWTGMWLGA